MSLAGKEGDPVETSVSVVSGDISQVQSDALISPINSGGMWYGAIDGAIQRSAGGQFHRQAAEKLPLEHGDTVVAKKTVDHRGKFGDVVFIIDDLQGPLSGVLLNGLRAADKAGYSSVTVPTMRMGVLAGVVEKTPQDVAMQMKIAVENFKAEGPRSLEKIIFVVYNDKQTEVLLEETFET